MHSKDGLENVNNKLLNANKVYTIENSTTANLFIIDEPKLHSQKLIALINNLKDEDDNMTCDIWVSSV